MATTVSATQMPLVQIANLLGGQKTTSNAGDTSAINSALAGLQGQNYDAMLQSIFQQAAGGIPQLANRMQNAAGARSGSNSAMAAALQDLLKTTTISAQDQIAKQQLANLQAQVQGGSAVAQATKGTTQKSGTDLLQTAKMLALLQGASKMGLMGEETKSTGTTGKQLAPVSDAVATPVSPFLNQDLTALNVIPESTFTGGGQDLSYLDMYSPEQANYEAAPYIPDMTTYDYGQQYEPVYEMGDQGFADGGKVEAKEPVEPDDKMTKANSLVAGDSVAINLSFETFRKLLGESLGKPEGYADGGRVSAAGSRRSANPSVAIQAPLTSAASNAGVATAGVLGLSALGGGGGNIPAGAMMSALPVGGATPYVDPEIGQALAMSSALSTLAKTNGYQGLPSEVGLAAGLANSSDTNDLARAGAKYAATTKAGSEAIKEQTGFTGGEVLTAYNVAKALDEGDEAAAINSAMWYVSPPVAAANTVSQMLGGPDIGTITVDLGAEIDDEILQPVGDVLSDFDDSVLQPVSNIVSDAGDIIGDVASGVGGAVSDVGSAIGDFFGWKEGGHIQGPGTGTSDSIPARLSDGEYVIPADVVDKVGVEFFDLLRASLHTPARKQ